jgi:hypothetical protein
LTISALQIAETVNFLWRVLNINNSEIVTFSVSFLNLKQQLSTLSETELGKKIYRLTTYLCTYLTLKEAEVDIENLLFINL